MITSARNSEDLTEGLPVANDYIAPVPRVSVQAFCETLLRFLGELSAAGGFVGDVQVLGHAMG